MMVSLHPKRISGWLDDVFEDFSIKSHLKLAFYTFGHLKRRFSRN